MRKLVAILIISLLSFVFILPKQASAQDNIRILYKDAVEHSNVFALFEAEQQLAEDPRGYKVIGISEDDFAKVKEKICKNYLDGAKSDPHITEDLLHEVRLACNIQSSLALKF